MVCIACHLDYPLHEFPDDMPRVCRGCRNRAGLVIVEDDDAVEWWVVAVEASGFNQPLKRYQWSIG